VTVVCLIGALWGIDFKEVTESFQRANYATLPVLLFLLFLYYWLKAIRWKLLLQPLRPFTWREVFPSMMIGFMGNNLLPSHLGEFIRVFVLGREFKLSKTAVFSSVVLERMFDVVVILGLLGVSPFLGEGLPEEGLPDALKTAIFIVAGCALLAIGVFAAYIYRPEQFVRLAEWILRIFLIPERLRTIVTEMLESGVAGLDSMRSPKLAFWIVVTSVLQWFFMACMVDVSLWSFGVRLPLHASFVVVGATAVSVAIPSTPGYFGMIQWAFRLSLEIFDVDPADAVAASVYFHISQYIPVTLAGLYYLSRLGMRLADIEKEATRSEQAKE